MTKKIVDLLVKNNAIDESDRAVYEYSVRTTVMFIITVLIGIFIGLHLGCLLPCIIYIALFIIMRKFTGGYHTKHRWSCISLSACIIYLCTYCITACDNLYTVTVVELVSVMIILILSPQENVNHPLKQYEKQLFHKIVIGLLCTYILVELVCMITGRLIYYNCIAICIISIATLQLTQLINIKFHRYRKM